MSGQQVGSGKTTTANVSAAAHAQKMQASSLLATGRAHTQQQALFTPVTDGTHTAHTAAHTAGRNMQSLLGGMMGRGGGAAAQAGGNKRQRVSAAFLLLAGPEELEGPEKMMRGGGGEREGPAQIMRGGKDRSVPAAVQSTAALPQAGAQIMRRGSGAAVKMTQNGATAARMPQNGATAAAATTTAEREEGVNDDALAQEVAAQLSRHRARRRRRL